MPWSRVNTEYSIHHVLHYPMIDCPPLPDSFSSLGRPCCTQFSTFLQLRVNPWIESQLPLRLPPELPPPDWPPPNTSSISLNDSLQVHLQTLSITSSKSRMIMSSKCIYKLARPQPPTVSLDSHDYGLQVCIITASKFISRLAQSQPPCTSLRSNGRITEIQG